MAKTPSSDVNKKSKEYLLEQAFLFPLFRPSVSPVMMECSVQTCRAPSAERGRCSG